MCGSVEVPAGFPAGLLYDTHGRRVGEIVSQMEAGDLPELGTVAAGRRLHVCCARWRKPNPKGACARSDAAEAGRPCWMRFLMKGSGVLVEGRLLPDKQPGGTWRYTRPGGSGAAASEIIANVVHFQLGATTPVCGRFALYQSPISLP
jgi:hypothetical protein